MEITIIRTLHDLDDQGVMSHNVTYLWQPYHICNISLTVVVDSPYYMFSHCYFLSYVCPQECGWIGKDFVNLPFP
jgi:hypothetical protein